MKKKKILLLSCLVFLFITGCSKKSEIKETTLSQTEIEQENLVFDENGNTGLYIKQEIEDVIPETIRPIENLTETTTNTQETIPETIETTIQETEPLQKIKIISDVNVRDGIYNGGVLGVLSAGTILERTNEVEGWSEIFYENQVGYVYNDYIEVINE